MIFVKADTNIIHVPTHYLTIQEAINNADPGDTIFVHQGVYYENIVANKSVSLVGEDKDLTIIDGNGTSSVIFIQANNVCVKNFTLRKSGALLYDSGIRIERSSGNVISNNIISSNYEGISLIIASSNNVISGNIISNNYDGISLFPSSNNVISGNIISNNYGGITLIASSNNVISGNTIALNDYCGISILSSINNIIYRNNFNNTVQVQSDSSINVWNYGFEGNYWSDYIGQDMNGDGIGENPYIIDANNQDDHPLLGTFFEFEVVLKKNVYDMTIISNSTISDFKFEIGSETGNKIIRFNIIGEDNTTGFCRVMIPIELMNNTFIIFVDDEEISPVILEITNETHVYLYFTYNHTSQVISIISSRMQYLYNELLLRYAMLQVDLYNLNLTYSELLNRYDILFFNYTQLLNNYNELNASYQKHLIHYNENVSNFQNLIYIFAALTAIFIITTVYLSKHVHANIQIRTKVLEDQSKC
jgi:parallel beta-helix repeat protein